MTLGLMGLKVGMTQVYDENGKIAPVTVIKLGPCPVLQVRDQQRDGYDAVQLGFLDKDRERATRAERGHVTAALETKRRRPGGKPLAPKPECEPQRHVREFRLEQPTDLKVGAVVTVVELFKKIKKTLPAVEKKKEEIIEVWPCVDVIGTTKGRGTAGAMKRHNFHGLGASHGVKKHHRSPGSVGSLASNRGSGRPKRGKKLPGRYGAERVTVRNLQIVKIDADNHLLLVRGGVPGANGSLVIVRPTNKKK